MGRKEAITKELKRYDPKLFCDELQEGKLAVFRKSNRVESYIMDDGSVLGFYRPAPFMIFCLTHNWLPSGEPVEWGVLPILKRLRDGDLWHRDVAGDIEKNEERIKEANERDLKNQTESFLYDFRDQFKKTFNEVNTANLNKKPKRKGRI